VKDDEYEKLIQKKEWSDLEDFWASVKSGTTSQDWAVGKALEYFVIKAFELAGFSVSYPYLIPLDRTLSAASRKTMEQIDGLASKDGLTLLIESKDEAKTNIEAIYKLYSQLQRRPPSTMGCLVFTGYLTDETLHLVNFLTPRRILLVDQNDLDFVAQSPEDFSNNIFEKYLKLCKDGFIEVPSYSEYKVKT